MSKDWYPTREAARRLFLQNFVTNIVYATTLLKLPANTYQAAANAAQAELDAFAARDAARKVADTAQAALLAQSEASAITIRANMEKLRTMTNVPQEVIDLLGLNTPLADAEAHTSPSVLKVSMNIASGAAA
jgi:hypothetical protein